MSLPAHRNLSPHTACIYGAIDAVSEELRSLSLKIHEHPELGLSEVKAHASLTEYLVLKGFQVEQSASELKTAFVAHAGNAQSQTVIGICSEYDALPGIGHACGHNLIAVAGVATAIGLKAVIDQFGLPARVKLFGTPSEEHDAGKVTMFDSGDFQGVDVCMMLHGANADVLYTPFLALNTVVVEFFGKASHASVSPWEGINALDAAVISYANIGLMRQQMKPDQRVHGIIQNGGQAANIIPAYTKSVYTVRAPKFAQMEELMARTQRIFEAAAESTGCTSKIEWGVRIHGKYMKDILTNGPLAERFELAMSDLGLKYASKEEQRSKLSGSTDMGNLTYEMPGIHPMFNIMNLEGVDDHSAGLHSVEFAAAAARPVGHAATLRAAKALALTGLECILDPVFLKRVKDSFAEQVRAP
ncbi:hypothetical protein EMPS_03040 [Entomortierella parvispora]|uniref:Peptidase M20 domain-containing protein 2 n=1 Tax=Entomortierella parvispora TaxID=205924 RepID=A0A9P3LUI2_9FUNG|nr:hypothetical protein EMPS_03040 [Entomortierella parvispora]